MASGTPSAQAGIPLTGPLLFPPLMLTLYYLGEKISGGWKHMQRQKKNKGASADGRRPNNCPDGPNFEKKSHSAKNCRRVQKTPYPDTLRDILCPKPNAIAHTLPKLYTILIHCRPILIHWRTYTPSLPNLYPILIHWRTQSRNYTYPNTSKKSKFSWKPNSYRQAIRIEYHSAGKNPNFLSWNGGPSRLSAPGEPSRLAIAYLNT